MVDLKLKKAAGEIKERNRLYCTMTDDVVVYLIVTVTFKQF